MEEKEKPPPNNYNIFSISIKNKKLNKIFSELSKHTKSVYNRSLFCFNILKFYESFIYDSVTEWINKSTSKVKNSDVVKKIYDIYDIKYSFYIKHYELYKKNNTLIYKYIKDNYGKTIIDNYNFNEIKTEIIDKLKTIIEFNEENKNFVFEDVIFKILKSFYDKTYFTIKNEMIHNKPFSINVSDKYIKNVKKENYYFDYLYKQSKSKYISKIKDVVKSHNLIYEPDIKPPKKTNNKSKNDKKEGKNKPKPKVNKKEYNLEEENKEEEDISINEGCILKYLVYRRLGDDKNKLPSVIINETIIKFYQSIMSYYALRASEKVKGKVNKPKYLKENEGYIIQVNNTGFKFIDNKKMRITVGYNIREKYIELIDPNANKYKNHYYNNNDICKLSKEEDKKEYVRVGKNKYVKKDKLINATYIYINIPKKFRTKKITCLSVIPSGNRFKVCFCYKIDKLKPVEIAPEKMNPKKSISIDLGIRNLMTIYNPSGRQKIIRGGKLISLNKYYNNIIDKQKSENKKLTGSEMSPKIYDLLERRTNQINGYFNKIINVLFTEYKDKELFIVGYNSGWKKGVNLGKETNRTFYEIPYRRLLTKLHQKCLKEKKQIKIIEESYTSKCDALKLEPICKQKKYMGKRIKRGLFSSGKKKLINADLNGAINIMRKVIDLKKITGENICNPVCINW